jgi:large subunit ribosomal protein L17
MKRGNKKKFGRVRNQRKALYKALATALIERKKIKTTKTKAKALSPFTDKLITKAKKNDIASRRILSRYLGQKAVKILINDIGPQFKERKGGYTRITKLGRRLSDGSEMAIIELNL